MKGKLIVIEGGDGSGKQTQTALLIQRLKHSSGYLAETMDFPQYHTFYGQIIRAYLDGQFGDPKQVSPLEAGALYCLNRFEAKNILHQWLNEGKIIVCDRYHTANIIHQGAKMPPLERKNLVTTLEALEFSTLGVPRPDLVIYLHVAPEAARKMMSAQGRVLDGLENDLAYAKKVEETALWACQEFGWIKIECCEDDKILPREDIHEKIWEIVRDA